MEFDDIMGFKLFSNSLSLISSPKKNIFLIIKRSFNFLHLGLRSKLQDQNILRFYPYH